MIIDVLDIKIAKKSDSSIATIISKPTYFLSMDGECSDVLFHVIILVFLGDEPGINTGKILKYFLFLCSVNAMIASFCCHLFIPSELIGRKLIHDSRINCMISRFIKQAFFHPSTKK